MPTTTDHLRVAPCSYTSTLMRDFAQKSLKLRGINQRYPHFSSVHYIAGDEEQYNTYRDDSDSKHASEPGATIPYIAGDFRADIESDVHKVYHGTLSRPVISDTFRYIFHKFKKGIYVKIRGGELVAFIPFTNAHFVNEYGRLIMPDGPPMSLLKDICIRDGYRFNPKNINGCVEKWFANNCLLRYEYPIAENDTNICAIRDMLDALTRNRKVPDYDFFINKRDFPILAEGKYEPYNHIFDSKTHPLVSHAYPQHAPIFSFSAAARNSDLLMPTVDDWVRVASSEGRFFTKTSNDYFPPPPRIAWEKKRSVAIWRGSSTGVGTTVNTNQRLKASKISKQLMLSGSRVQLDAGITAWKCRPRKIEGMEGLQTIDIAATKLSLVNKIPFAKHAEYKYVVHIGGHTSAYRLAAELSLGSVILIVEGEYKLWFQRFMKEDVHYVSVKYDLSDLERKIEWLMDHDAAAKIIAENGKRFFDERLTKNGILDYMENTLCALAQKIPLDAWVDQNVKIPRVVPNSRITIDDKSIIKMSKKSMVYSGRVGELRVVEKCGTTNLSDEYTIGIEIVNQLHSKNFARTLHYFDNSIVTQFEEGPTLLEKLQNEPDFHMKELAEILIKTLTAVQLAQDSNYFTHNDLSAANVICKRSTFYQPVIIDFGMATGVSDSGNLLACSYMTYSETQDSMHLVMSTLYHLSRRKDARRHSKMVRLLSGFVSPYDVSLETDIVRWAIRFTSIEAKFSRITNQFSNRRNPRPVEIIEGLQKFSPCHTHSPRNLVNYFVKKETVRRMLAHYSAHNGSSVDMANYLLCKWRGVVINKVNEKGEKLFRKLAESVRKKIARIHTWKASWLEKGLAAAQRGLNGDKLTASKTMEQYIDVINWNNPRSLSISDVKLLIGSVISKKYSIILQLKIIFRIIKYV